MVTHPQDDFEPLDPAVEELLDIQEYAEAAIDKIPFN